MPLLKIFELIESLLGFGEQGQSGRARSKRRSSHAPDTLKQHNSHWEIPLPDQFGNLNDPSPRKLLRPPRPAPPSTRTTTTIRNSSWWLALILLLVSTVIGFQSGLVFLCNIKRSIADDLTSHIDAHHPHLSNRSRDDAVEVTSVNLPRVPEKRQLVLIAVMTSKDFLTTRAPTVMRTWADKVPGEVFFFSSEGSTTNDSRINLISLPFVTDTYPPQKKSFLMMKYIHDHYLNKFEWFMRVDDDVYIRTDNLEKLIRSIDNRNPYYIGQPGTGTKEEFGNLGLHENENFCMGGPGIILSRETLARFTPHIKKCLKNFRSYHEDVELGRCVHRFANTSCTWTYEMQHILFNHPNKTDGYRAANLVSTDILRAVSLHSIKDTRVFTRVHNFALQRRIIDMEQRNMVLQRQIDIYDQLLDIHKQIKLHTRNLSRLIQTVRNPQVKLRLKQHYKVLNKPDQHIAEQLMSLHNNTHRLFTSDDRKPQAYHAWRVLQEFYNRSLNASSPAIPQSSYMSNGSVFRALLNPTLAYDHRLSTMAHSKTMSNHRNKLSRDKADDEGDATSEPSIYTLFTGSQYVANAELPVRSTEPVYEQCLNEIVRTYMEEVNKISRTMGRFLEYRKTLYAYHKHTPRIGANYILDLYLIYRKYSGKKMSLPVRKRVYVVQKFRPLHFRELPTSYPRAIQLPSGAGSSDPLGKASPVIAAMNTVVPIQMIVPVSGRLTNLKRLLTNFERVVLRETEIDFLHVHLHIILMETAEDSGERMSTLVDYVTKFISEHQATRIHLVEVKNSNFTRGYARAYGAAQFNDTDLLFFIDLDMVFTRELFARIRYHTIFHKQVYFPVIFSQYDPHFWENAATLVNFTSFPLRDDVGYWRQYGFGMLGIYKADLGSIGNWNVEINGWGKEDVEIYDKLVRSSTLSVFRTIDTSLMHVFHAKECALTLRDDQMQMCKGTRSITLGSQRILANDVRQKIELNKT